jgi:DeoR/GlpR family transcriptional regulator of sugar metabolism
MRKPHRRLTVEQAVVIVERRGIVSVADVAAEADVSTATARRCLDGGVSRGVLIRDEYDADGRRLRHEDWRFTTVA